MSEFGGADSHTLKSALDCIFNTGGNTPLEYYNTKLVSPTSSGANVNLVVYNGTLKILKVELPWLVFNHCVNHRLELAIKDAVKGIAQFAECDKFYTNIYYLFKNSSKLKTDERGLQRYTEHTVNH